MGYMMEMMCDFCGEGDSGFTGCFEDIRRAVRKSGWLIRKRPGGFWKDELLCPDCAERGEKPKTMEREFNDIPLFDTIHPDFQWDGKTPITESLSNYLKGVSDENGR